VVFSSGAPASQSKNRTALRSVANNCFCCFSGRKVGRGKAGPWAWRRLITAAGVPGHLGPKVCRAFPFQRQGRRRGKICRQRTRMANNPPGLAGKRTDSPPSRGTGKIASPAGKSRSSRRGGEQSRASRRLPCVEGLTDGKRLSGDQESGSPLPAKVLMAPSA